MTDRRAAPPDDPPGPVPGWIGGARPRVPPELAPWLTGAPDGDDVRGLTEAALDALARAEDAAGAPPVGRERAFHLLAADALLTYACEAALDGPRPDRVLRDLARRVAEGGSGSSGGRA